MYKTFLVATFLAVGTGFSARAQVPVSLVPTPDQAAFVEISAAPRAATVLALATPVPESLDLTAPVPAAYLAPATAARPTDGLQTTRIVLGIAAAAVALIGAVLALKQ